jgi:hypothetical protein
MSIEWPGDWLASIARSVNSVIPAGSLDQEPDFMPQGRIFSGSRAAWSCHDGDLPEYDEYSK